jgi:branched-chain amino acid transport system substrate-binding protein
MKVTRAGVLVGAALAVVLAGCGSGGDGNGGASSGSQITLGMLQPLTGASAAVGLTGRQGAELAVAQINDTGGINGRKLKLQVLDDAGDVTTGTNAFTKVLSDKPVAILGPNISAVALALVPRLEREQVPLLTGALSPDLTKSGSPWVFRIRSSDTTAAQNLVDYALTTLKPKSIALIGEESDYGQGGIAAVKAELQAKGVTPVAAVTFSASTNDLSSQVIKLKQSGADAVIYWGSQSPAALFAKQAKQFGFTGTILGSNAYTDQSVLQLAGSAADNIYSVVNFIPTGDDPAVQKFVSAYKQKYGSDPDSYAASYFDAVNVVAAAIKAGGPTAKAIADSLKTLQYQGLASVYKYHDNGEMTGPQEITQVRSGKPVVVSNGQ